MENLIVLEGILLNGEHLAPGTVVAKSAFAAKGDWQNLVFGFSPPRLEETDAKVGPAPTTKAKMPTA
jgi:hypothetical protein